MNALRLLFSRRVVTRFSALQNTLTHSLTYLLTYTHTHTRLTALFSGTTQVSLTRKVKPLWILLKQETVSGSGISWAICKSAPRSRQISTPAPHHSVFTGRMPFLPPNQQRQSTEGKYLLTYLKINDRSQRKAGRGVLPPAGAPHAHTDRRTGGKHNACGPVYRMGGTEA